MAKPRTAEDYDDDVTAASRSALAELALPLGSHRDALVLIGGWASYLILEDPDVSQGKVAFGALSALGDDVAARSEIYVWPAEHRSRDANGHHGSLHAKCAVADDRWLLVSSANLTDHAFHLKIELGGLVRGAASCRRESHGTGRR